MHTAKLMTEQLSPGAFELRRERSLRTQQPHGSAVGILVHAPGAPLAGQTTLHRISRKGMCGS
eukprot:COSAG03_NODE_23107_length_283_cov_0.847826_2_plen_62_part_01